MQDGRDERERHDENGDSWLVDQEGRYVTDGRGNRIPGSARREPGGFYDTSRGHCGMCGSLMCRGGCFK